MIVRAFYAVVPTALAMVIAACSAESASSSSTSASSSGACKPHDASAVDLSRPVSFRADVLPTLRMSCGLSSSCHGGSRSPVMAARLDPSATRDGLVDKPAVALPRMTYVSPSDPDASFLMHKMDGDQCLFDAECAGGSCKRSMPDGDAVLPAEQRDAIRRWIAQGALDN